MSNLPEFMFGMKLETAEVTQPIDYQSKETHKKMCKETIKYILDNARNGRKISLFASQRFYSMLAECSIKGKWSIERVRRETENLLEMQTAGPVLPDLPRALPPRIILRSQEEHEKGEWKVKDLVLPISEFELQIREKYAKIAAEEELKRKEERKRESGRVYPLVVRFDEESITHTKSLAQAARREIRKKRAIARSRARAALKNGNSELGARKRAHTSTIQHSEDPMMEKPAKTSTEILALSSANCVLSDTDIKTKIANIHAKISALSGASSLPLDTRTTNTKSSFVTYCTYKRPHSPTGKDTDESEDKKRRKTSSESSVQLHASSVSSDDNTMTSNDSIDVTSE